MITRMIRSGQPLQSPRRFQMWRTIMALLLREMSTTYGRSPGGYLWTILVPVGGIAMLTLVLAAGLRIRNPSLGINFPLFYATGLLPLMLYQRTSTAVAAALRYSRALLFYPGVTFVDAIAARFLVQVLTNATVMYVVLGGILLLFDTRAIVDLPPVLLAFCLAALLGVGIGSLNAYLFPTFPLWEQVWSILTFPLFLLSGVIFIYEDLPQVGQQVLWYNPLIHISGLMRTGFYPVYHPSYIEPLYVLGFGLIPLVLGLMLLRRHHTRIMNL